MKRIDATRSTRRGAHALRRALGLGLMLSFMACGVSAAGDGVAGSPYDLGGGVVAGGGGQASGGGFSLQGWIGALAAGTSRGGSYTLEVSGPLPASRIPDPGAPRLSIAFVGGMVLLSWGPEGAGFKLESTTVLTAAPWTLHSVEPTATASGYVVRLPIQSEPRFYRLRR